MGLLITQLLISSVPLGRHSCHLIGHSAKSATSGKQGNARLQDLRGMQTPAVQKDKDIIFIHHPSVDKTYIFGSQELHAFGHLVGKTEQIGGGEALIHVI